MIIEEAKRVIRIEAEALSALADSVDISFEQAVRMILSAKGRVIVTGMGKSGLVGQKIASTMASTGTPAFFLHPGEALHGDLGMIIKGDVVIAISNSGETEEVLRILPIVKRIGAELVSMTGKSTSTLAKAGDIHLNIAIKEEACPLGLAPTASTTATLAMGDALAVALLVERGFKAEDFALFHPGGALGKKLLLTVGDMMHSDKAMPLVRMQTPMREALFEITSKGLGCAGVLDAEGNLAGVITDGDLRRALEKGTDFMEKSSGQMMTANPKRILASDLAAKGLQKMEQFSITTLFVFEHADSAKPVGILHLHDLLKSGLA